MCVYDVSWARLERCPIAGSPFVAPVSIFDSTVHLLHGVLHANGFGHLLRINGLEGGSQHVTGTPLPQCTPTALCQCIKWHSKSMGKKFWWG